MIVQLSRPPYNKVFFYGNYVEGDADSAGGAIYSKIDLSLVSRDGNTVFSNNKVNGKANDIYMSGTNTTPAKLNIVLENGIASFDGGIDGQFYDINISGNEMGRVDLYNSINDASNIKIDNTIIKFAQGANGKGNITSSGDDAVTSLSLNNATLDMANGYLDVVKLNGYNASNSVLKIDVNPDTMSSDLIDVKDNVAGSSNIIIYASSNKNIQDLGSIVFAKSTNDTTGNQNSFNVSRVFSSPYLYDVIYTDNSTGKEWAFAMNNTNNPDYDGFLVSPEVVSYIGLQSMALEQTRGLSQVVSDKINCNNRLGCKDFRNGNNLWVDTSYVSSNIDEPIDASSSIWGITAGGDLQSDINNKLGLFMAYRQGNYDLNSG